MISLIKYPQIKTAALAIVLSLWVNIIAAQTVVYPAPVKNFDKTSSTYVVNVTQNGITKNSFVYKSDIGALNPKITGRQNPGVFNYTTFSFSGKVSVEVIRLNSTAGSAIIRPALLNVGSVSATRKGINSVVKFVISKPAKFSVEFDDDPALKNVLVIFADRLEKPADIPTKTNKPYYVKPGDSLTDIPKNAGVIYFKPGVYKIGYWAIPATVTQVYLAGGAYVKGYLSRNVDVPLKINGRGILSNDDYSYHYPTKAPIGTPDDYKKWYQMINLARGQNHVIEGITLINGTGFCISAFVSNTVIDNVNIHGFRFNNDAISIGGTGNIINDCFMRVYDDAIIPYSSNLTITNCTFWQLSGSVIQLGWAAHSMDGISISNCFVLHDHQLATSQNLGFISAMNFGEGPPRAVIQNINVDNIYFETPIYRFVDIRGGRNYQIAGYKKGTNSSTWVYRNMSFKNIHFSQDSYQYPLVYLQGLNADNLISDVSFEGIYFNKKRLPAAGLLNSSFINLKNTLAVGIK